MAAHICNRCTEAVPRPLTPPESKAHADSKARHAMEHVSISRDPQRRHRVSDGVRQPLHAISAAFVLLAVLISAGEGFAAEKTLPPTDHVIYAPVYSHIYFGDRAKKFNLAATLSIRNTDPDQTITIVSADYHDSGGKLVKKHLAQPLILGPLASTEVFVPERDTSGGFGASFVVRWTSAMPVNPPIVECVMIGVRSGQGISIIGEGRAVQDTPR